MRTRPLALFALICTLFSCRTARPPTATTTGHQMAARIENTPGLENFARVDARLYRGAQPTAEGYKNLKALGVKTVISFRSNTDTSAEAKAAGLTYLKMPVQADILGSEPPTAEQVKTFFDTVLDPARQPVFIHCMGGKDRTGTLCALYRMEIDGWTNEEAIQEMQAFGFHDNYKDLMNYVKGYKTQGYGGESKVPSPK